jgi:assimilatory nitrate reductase catalytic subunit
MFEATGIRSSNSHMKSHCPYCALQCGIVLAGEKDAPSLCGDAAFPVNEGALCIKGWTAARLLGHEERLREPLARDAAGALVPVSWDEALARITEALRGVQLRHGRDAVGVLGSGSLTNEKAYLLGKFARVALGTASIDYNGRFCMSSAAAAAKRAFGLDRGLPFPVEDIRRAEAVLLVGANPAETMPPLMRFFNAQREAGGTLVVADPRRTSTAQAATLHLALAPGTDTVLAHGLLHVLIRDGLVDEAYVRRRTEGFDKVRAAAAAYWPERVERVTGVPEAKLVQAAHALGRARTAMVLTARGAEQHAQGVANALAFVNVALALGLPGRAGSGYGTITGQGNGQGGREHGQKSDQLPGDRRIDDPAARRHVARVWGVAPESLPRAGRSAFEMLRGIGGEGGVRALLVFGTNPAVSAPDGTAVGDRLAALELLVVSDFFLSETARLAHVVLPSAQWAEEDGTTTNLEGRVVRRRKAFDPPHGVRTDLEILAALARALGRGEGFEFAGAPEVFDELRRASKGGAADYAGITYERIDREGGVFWPCPSDDHPGTPRLFEERFPTKSGRARFHAVRPTGPAEAPDAEFPLFLTTGRVLAHYQSGTQTRRVAELVAQAAEPLAEVHPLLARQHALAPGDTVRIATRRGAASFKVRIAPEIRADTVFLPFHWGGEQSANRLTNTALDPVSRMPEFKVCAARLERAPADDRARERAGRGADSVDTDLERGRA